MLDPFLGCGCSSIGCIYHSDVLITLHDLFSFCFLSLCLQSLCRVLVLASRVVRVSSPGHSSRVAAAPSPLAPEASRPAKRKKPAPSSPYAKRAREGLSIAATRKLEAEKKRLSLINTSNKGQPAIQHFFKPSG